MNKRCQYEATSFVSGDLLFDILLKAGVLINTFPNVNAGKPLELSPGWSQTQRRLRIDYTYDSTEPGKLYVFIAPDAYTGDD